MTQRPRYPRSCYRATVGEAPLSEWLAADDLLAHFANDRRIARQRYRHFVNDRIAATKRPWSDLVGQMYLGSEAWIDRMREKVELEPRSDEHPRAQRILSRPSMAEIVTTVSGVMGLEDNTVRKGRGGVPRMVAAWLGSHEGLLTNREIAAGLRLRSASHVTALVQSCDRELKKNETIRQAVDGSLTTLRRKNRQPKI